MKNSIALSFLGDCLEVMDNLISQNITVDAIITDPPYGTTACKWDSVIPIIFCSEPNKFLFRTK